MSYTVQPGDTLWSIASAGSAGDPRSGVAAIREVNDLATDTIRPGDVLLSAVGGHPPHPDPGVAAYGSNSPVEDRQPAVEDPRVSSPPTITPVLVADLLAEGERMPVYVHVIDHPDGRVLVDTGMTELHPAVADMDPRLRPLSEQDLDLAGIDIVVNTHLHFDHCGGNHLFAGRPIYVQRRELDDARTKDDYTIREWVDAPGVQYVPVDGELELLPGLRLVPAPGHTRGMQVVVVRRAGVRSSSAATWRCGSASSTSRHRRPAAGARARPRAGLADAHESAVAAWRR